MYMTHSLNSIKVLLAPPVAPDKAQMFLSEVRQPSLRTRCGLAARALASEQGDTGPLRPAHIHAAFHQLGGQGKVPQRVRGRHRRL